MIDISTLTTAQLDELGNDMEAGLTKWASALKLTQVTPAEIATQLAAFLAVDASYNAERTKRQGLSDAVQAAQADLAAWLLVVKNALCSSFGNQWNSQWIAVGFISPSLEIPGTIGKQASLGMAMTAFLTSNPSYEVPKTKVTAAQGTALQTALSTAKQALKDEQSAFDTLTTQWNTAYDTLIGTMRSLIGILLSTMAADDPRWPDFGLTSPATPSTPGKPVNVTATTDGTGAIIVQCHAVPLAKRYRWRTLLVGLQTDYILAASTTQPMASLSGYVPGKPVQIIVQAVNGNLQGVPSDPIVFTLPLEKVAEVKVVAAEPAPISNGNGSANGNGHANGPSNIHPEIARR